MDIGNFTDLRTLGMDSLKMSSLQIDRMLSTRALIAPPFDRF